MPCIVFGLKVFLVQLLVVAFHSICNINVAHKELRSIFLIWYIALICVSIYTEHQKRLITSSGRRSLKSTQSKLIIFGHK